MYNNENEYSGTSFEYNNGFAPGNNGFAFAALINERFRSSDKKDYSYGQNES